MLVLSFKMTKQRITAGLFAVLAIMGIGIYFFNNNQPTNGKIADMRIATNAQRLAYIDALGWKVSEEPTLIQELAVPSEFDDVYKSYNELLKKTGYDLEKHKGQKLTKYTYSVQNHKNSQAEEVVLNLLVVNEKVIGGDISSAKLGGFMEGLGYNSNGQQESASLNP